MSDISQRSPSVSIPSRPIQQPVLANQPLLNTPTPEKRIKGLRVSRFLHSKRTIVVIVVIVITCVTIGLLARNSNNSSADAAAKKPNYKTALPEGKTVAELGGWKRVSPAKDDPVFAYIDQIDSVTVSVSQQPLPQSFKSNVANQVAELAKKFNATDKIDAKGTAVYIGTSSKGPQSVIFSSNNLLILIKSEKQIADTSWATYVESLK